MNVTPHFVVPDANEAASWYERAFGAQEQSRVPLPGGKVMTVVLQIGDSTVHSPAAKALLTLIEADTERERPS